MYSAQLQQFSEHTCLNEGRGKVGDLCRKWHHLRNHFTTMITATICVEAY